MLEVAGAGDVNGDGIDDFLVGAPDAEPVSRVYLVYGSPTGWPTRVLLSEIGVTVPGIQIVSAGQSVGSLGQAGSTTSITLRPDVWLFDPVGDQWEQQEPLAAPAGWTSAAYDPVADRTILLLVWSTGRYDADTDQWTWLDPPQSS